MAEPLLRSFTRFEDATAARDALVASGLPPECIELRVADDEAGPVEGNFVAGNRRREVGDGPSRSIIAGGEIPYDQNFANTVSRGAHLLIVTAADETRRIEAHRILDQFTAVDPTAPSPAAVRE
jgi:hypothetical protein